MAESPVSESFPGMEDGIGVSPPKRRFSNGLNSPRMPADNDPVSPREHTFVKTTFSKRVLFV
jgi:hypothetical protein